MVDSVRFQASIKRTEVISNYSIKRMAVVIQEKDVPKYNEETNKAGFKPDERWRFIYEPNELVNFGFDLKSEGARFLLGALKGKGKFANINFLPSLTELEVLCIVKKEDEKTAEAIEKANLSMKFDYYGLVIAKSLETDMQDVIKAFSKDYLIAVEDDTLFGNVVEPNAPSKTKTKTEKHLFETLINTNALVSLNYQLPKTRGELEFPISAVVMGYICATFGTERPGVSVYFKTLEGVEADNFPSFIVSQIDQQYNRRINTYRANEANSYKWNLLANGESVEMMQLVKYTENIIKTINQNLIKSGLPFNDNGFAEVKEETERFMGLLLRAEKIQSFEVIVPSFSSLNSEAREKSLLPYKATIVSGGVTKELELSAIFSK